MQAWSACTPSFSFATLELWRGADSHRPKHFTKEWVKEHVHEVHFDDLKALAELRDSVAGDHPTTKLEQILAFRQGKGNFYGYELRVPVRKKDGAVYQDGSPLAKSTPRSSISIQLWVISLSTLAPSGAEAIS